MIEAIDLECGQHIWVEKFDCWLEIIDLNYPISGQVSITFENYKTLIVSQKKKFKLL